MAYLHACTKPLPLFAVREPTMLRPDDLNEPGFYWYLDALGSAPQVVEVVGSDALTVRFAGRQGEDEVRELQGTFVGPLRPPGAQQALSEVEHRAVQAALARTNGRSPRPPKDAGEGHPR
jgi:hypothetical protein